MSAAISGGPAVAPVRLHRLAEDRVTLVDLDHAGREDALQPLRVSGPAREPDQDGVGIGEAARLLRVGLGVVVDQAD